MFSCIHRCSKTNGSCVFVVNKLDVLGSWQLTFNNKTYDLELWHISQPKPGVVMEVVRTVINYQQAHQIGLRIVNGYFWPRKHSDFLSKSYCRFGVRRHEKYCFLCNGCVNLLISKERHELISIPQDSINILYIHL